MNDAQSKGVRLDKWLWASRFFKTRSLAANAVSNGRVMLNGVRPKVSRSVQIGDELRIQRADLEYEIIVTGLSDKRGSASIAQTLYEESQESIAAREEQIATNKAAAISAPRFEGRPDKRGRRELKRLRTSSEGNTG